MKNEKRKTAMRKDDAIGDLIRKKMIWVSIQKRKPIKEGYYYWKGKSNYGGKAYYNTEENKGNAPYGFDFDNSIPVNKVDEDYLYWLDEENAQYEERD